MLKLENFDALRLSIASPEMILSWSHGEVTKPETINYRTLKPERDGLFCERIFGPTKDWECHCGKYKRYRYKGIICDKCGVEVTRSKVRRERMGHIKLASPVSHVWYFKGIPSRMGLLLDMSPRNLEKVLYFANYIVTHIDENARHTQLDKLDTAIAERITAINEQHANAAAGSSTSAKSEIAKIDADLEKKRSALETDSTTRRTSVKESQADLEDRIASGIGKKAPANLSLTDGTDSRVVIEKGTIFGEDTLATVTKACNDWLDEIESSLLSSMQKVQDTALAKRDKLASEIPADAATATDDEVTAIREDVERTRKDLESLSVRDLLTDNQYREYIDKFPKVFKASMGGAAIRDLLHQIDLLSESMLLREESRSTSGQRRQKAIKRLRVVEAFRKSEASPGWMVLDVLPVIPPELRPMVQLDGGRFATSDLNDLYRRVINRNNRLKKLLDLGAPEIIVRNEKRMLQEAVDALIDNGRRGRAITGTGNRKLKSLSDMLKGKQGRFRQNLLGKRVDYSGRSVIVVGPELKLHQCGLPKKMALELFKPFVMRELVSQNYTQNIKSAKRMVERVRPEVWDVLEGVITDHPVLLNRAPTLHRLGIQAFMPILVEGQALQIHPLVCKAFNADFDGDQMAVHVPLFSGAVAEAKNLMMSSNNILNAANGSPVIAPSQDIVLGSYYLTLVVVDIPTDEASILKMPVFGSRDEAMLAYEHDRIGIHQHIRVRMRRSDAEPHRPNQPIPSGTVLLPTTVGRVIFNQVLPLGDTATERDLASMSFFNEVMDSKKLGALIKECFELYGSECTAVVANEIKRLGFTYATRAGITVSAMDIKTPEAKKALVQAAEEAITEVDKQFRRGLITDDERYVKTVTIWNDTTDAVTKKTMASFDRMSSVLMMSQSGARGSVQQVRQLAGMRGLVADPTGRIIDLPIKANFSEGLTVLEYFISTHGARKGLADTALRTADSGYLTRRLVDVAQDVIVREVDCGSTGGVWIALDDRELGDRVVERFQGRIASQEIAIDGEIIAHAGEEISNEMADTLYQNRTKLEHIKVRSTTACKAREGVCGACYGRNLATGRLVEMGEAVGVIAAQSIGEPGTQLTMRTFHTGGVATGGADITQGLPRVEEVFEARVPKGKAIITEIDGEVEIIKTDAKASKIRIFARDVFDTTYDIPPKGMALVETGQHVEEGSPVVRSEGGAIITARHAGDAKVSKTGVLIRTSDEESREYAIPASSRIGVQDGDQVVAGDRLTEGSISPQELLLVRGKDDVQNYLVGEIQKVYRSQGVDINDKHIEVIVRQMMRKVRIDNPGDTELLPGEIISQMEWEEANAKSLSEGGEPAIAQTVLLGLIKAALNTASWLSAASFQETTRVLTEAAISGKVDKLRGLKENVIIGKLIPAGTGLDYYRKLREEAAQLYQAQEILAVTADNIDDTHEEMAPAEGDAPVSPQEEPAGSI